MPKDLAALLLEDGAVPADALERAQARQREVGGALDTALLELGAIAEDALVEHLARAAELPAAPPAAWSAGDPRARRVFPSRVAERHGLAPFALEGRELSLVATWPVDLALLEEISFMLSLHLGAHVGPEWRVRELIHRLYGTPLAPRLAALAAAAGVSAAPPPGDAAPAESVPAAPPPPPPPTPLTGFARDDSEPREPLAAAIRQALESFDPALFEPGAGEEAATEEPERRGPPPDRAVPPRWTLADARAALAAAERRDDVVLVALRYARDFLEYAALFAVTRDAVAGHDALGAEDERERARSLAIYAADPGIFRTVIETRSPYLGPITRDAQGNAAILDGLGRADPRTVLVYPVLLRDRPVCILYADNGEAPVSPRRLGDLLLLLSSTGAALERILRQRKQGRARPAEGGAIARPAAEALPEAPAAAAPVVAAPAPAALPAAGPAPEPPPLPALADRALDPDPEVSALARTALAERRRDPAARPVVDRLRRVLLSGLSGRPARAAQTLGALRDTGAIPLLIQVLETSEPETAAAAAAALADITLQRLGPDARRWLGWWKQNRGRGRVEWLFEALTSDDREARLAASTELALAAPPPVAYSADAPAQARERTARAWAAWWAQSGHFL